MCIRKSINTEIETTLQISMAFLRFRQVRLFHKIVHTMWERRRGFWTLINARFKKSTSSGNSHHELVIALTAPAIGGGFRFYLDLFPLGLFDLFLNSLSSSSEPAASCCSRLVTCTSRSLVTIVCGGSANMLHHYNIYNTSRIKKSMWCLRQLSL